jgi:hypothetical protein
MLFRTRHVSSVLLQLVSGGTLPEFRLIPVYDNQADKLDDPCCEAATPCNRFQRESAAQRCNGVIVSSLTSPARRCRCSSGKACATRWTLIIAALLHLVTCMHYLVICDICSFCITQSLSFCKRPQSLAVAVTADEEPYRGTKTGFTRMLLAASLFNHITDMKKSRADGNMQSV